jgi:hypothetical protein
MDAKLTTISGMARKYVGPTSLYTRNILALILRGCPRAFNAETGIRAGRRMDENRLKRWTDRDVEELRRLAAAGIRVSLIARTLSRSSQAVRAKALQLRISLASRRVFLSNKVDEGSSFGSEELNC